MPDAVVAYIERKDGRLLCVWNRRYGGWSFPGGKRELGETLVDALVREVSEETGLTAHSYHEIYSGYPSNILAVEGRGTHVIVYRVAAWGTPCECEVGCPVTWFTREEFLKWSPFREFYAEMFARIPPEEFPE